MVGGPFRRRTAVRALLLPFGGVGKLAVARLLTKFRGRLRSLPACMGAGTTRGGTCDAGFAGPHCLTLPGTANPEMHSAKVTLSNNNNPTAGWDGFIEVARFMSVFCTPSVPTMRFLFFLGGGHFLRLRTANASKIQYQNVGRRRMSRVTSRPRLFPLVCVPSLPD